MKFAVATLLAASAAKSANAQSVSVDFGEGIPFTGFDGSADCEEGTEFLTGMAISVSVSDDIPDAVCEETEYTMDGETFKLYTGVVIQCASTAIGKNYFFCNEDCTKCDEEPFQYGTQSWDDVGADADECYANSATMGDGDETTVLTSSWSFDDDADPDDVKKYNDFAMKNTCIGDGPPELGEEEAFVDCLPYSEYVCQTIDDTLPYTLDTACSIFKDLGGEEPFNSTLFVPTDEAFEKFGKLVDANDMDRLDEDMVGEVIMYHGTNHTVLYDDLECMGKIEMWNGVNSRTKCKKTPEGNIDKFQKGGGNRENELLPKIVLADVLACDGNVIHIIDEVMLPNDIDKIV
jgi:hypothetical protein